MLSNYTSEAVFSSPTDHRTTDNLNGGLPNGNYMPAERGQTTMVDRGDLSEEKNEDLCKSPKFCIKRQNVKRAYSMCTVLLHDGQLISQSNNCYPHLCIQVDEYVAYETDGPSFNFNMLDMHCQSLREFIKVNISSKTLNWADRVKLIKQLSEAIQHGHGFDKQHGNLSVDCISISSDPSNRPFIWSVPESEHIAPSCDIQGLGEVAYFILTNGEDYSGTIDQEKIRKCYRLNFAEKLADMSLEPVETARDLLNCAIFGELKINDVTSHPFFWSDNEKATFISDLFDSLGTNVGALEEVEKQLNVSVFGTDWIKELRIRPMEKRALIKTDEKGNVNMDIFLNKAKGSSVKVCQYDISSRKLQEIRVVGMDGKKWKRFKKSGVKVGEEFQTLIQENTWMEDDTQCVMLQNVVFRKVEERPPYDGSSLYDLMRFLRNRKVHCYQCPKESSKGNQELEYYKHLGGYWNFYSARFPKLLVLLYQHVSLFPHYKVEWQ